MCWKPWAPVEAGPSIEGPSWSEQADGPILFRPSSPNERPDDIGVELSDLDAARKRAAAYAGELLGDGRDVVWSGEDWVLQVRMRMA